MSDAKGAGASGKPADPGRWADAWRPSRHGDRVVWNQLGGPTVTETSYARVFEHPDPHSEYRYAMFYMANETDNIRRIRLAESVDGITWTVDPDDVVVPGAGDSGNVSGANLWEWDGQLYVIYHNSTGNVMARTIDPTLREVGAAQLLHSSSGVGEDVGRTAAPEIVTDETGTYLFLRGRRPGWGNDRLRNPQPGRRPADGPRGPLPGRPGQPRLRAVRCTGVRRVRGHFPRPCGLGPGGA